jgi:hypothetical protein
MEQDSSGGSKRGGYTSQSGVERRLTLNQRWTQELKFARIVFMVAGVWGVLIIVPLYFIYDFIGRQSPPAINHPEFYYGFAGVTLAWQVVFLLIARDPARYRVMIIPSILEKLLYVIAILLLFTNGRVSVSQAISSTIDLMLALLFITAFLKTRSAS